MRAVQVKGLVLKEKPRHKCFAINILHKPSLIWTNWGEDTSVIVKIEYFYIHTYYQIEVFCIYDLTYIWILKKPNS